MGDTLRPIWSNSGNSGDILSLARNSVLIGQFEGEGDTVSLNKRWLFVGTLCTVCIGLICYYWYREITVYVPNPGQIPSQAAIDAALDDGSPHAGRIMIPTGVFIQSVGFVQANDVNVTGYIWQKYGDDIPDDVSRGFVFPEEVASADTVIREEYRREGTIGWYFDVTLRQPFDYSKYPLDTQDVWLRLWHKDFDRDVVLVPDLGAYRATGLRDIFGVDSQVVTGGWQIVDTHFFYRRMSYDTNFGTMNHVGRINFPELHFNITLRRLFLNALVVALVPLIIVLILLYSVLILATADKERAEALGFSATGAIGAASGLLFVIMLAHIDVRKEFAAAGLLYLEYFYLITYAAVLGVSLNVYLFSAHRDARFLHFLHRDDNFLPKLMFWPIVLLFLAAVTAITFS